MDTKEEYYQYARELLEIRTMSSKLSYERDLSSLLKGETLVLLFLGERGGHMHPREITEKMKISTARTAVILGQLEKEGYIERNSDSKDSRQINVMINEAGKEHLKEIKEHIIAYFAEKLSKLDEQDIRDLLRIERKLFNENLVGKPVY